MLINIQGIFASCNLSAILDMWVTTDQLHDTWSKKYLFKYFFQNYLFKYFSKIICLNIFSKFICLNIFSKSFFIKYFFQNYFHKTNFFKIISKRYFFHNYFQFFFFQNYYHKIISIPKCYTMLTSSYQAVVKQLESSKKAVRKLASS